jgi:hypothetical protein
MRPVRVIWGDLSDATNNGIPNHLSLLLQRDLLLKREFRNRDSNRHAVDHHYAPGMRQISVQHKAAKGARRRGDRTGITEIQR